MLREIEEGRGHTSIIDFRTRMRHYLLHGNADARFTTEDQPANLAELPY
jgi:hypothetical protein